MQQVLVPESVTQVSEPQQVPLAHAYREASISQSVKGLSVVGQSHSQILPSHVRAFVRANIESLAIYRLIRIALEPC